MQKETVNYNLVRKIVNNPWTQPPVTREQAIEKVLKLARDSQEQIVEMGE